MSFLNRILNIKNTKREFTDDAFQSPLLGTLNFNTATNYSTSHALRLSVVYRCINLVSDSIASLPLVPYTYNGEWKTIDYSNNIYNLLNVQPNQYMGAFSFKKLLITSMILKGNAYVYIERNADFSVKHLHIINADTVEVMIINAEKKYRILGSEKIYDDADIIHCINYSQTGLLGISTLSYAVTSLGIAADSERHTHNFFKSGANLFGLLTTKAGVPANAMNDEKAKKAKENFTKAFSKDSTINGNYGIAVIDSALEYQQISISPKDSQLLQSRAYNVVDLCRFMGIPPGMAFDMSSKYTNSEQQQLDYLNNTLQPIMQKLENEFFRKLYPQAVWDNSELKFDPENLMRVDLTAYADYLTKLSGIGGFTPNEVREKLNMKFPLKGGNRGFIAVNLQPTDNLISEQKNTVDNSKQIDNKLK